MRIILSRKGFDKGSGGCPSPYFIDENKLFSLPIPSEENYFSYRDLCFTDEMTCYDLMEQLKINKRKYHAHTDPDVRRDLYVEPPENWKPLFGQQGPPQKFLSNRKVGTGDLFLFYGLFKDVKKIGGTYQFIDNTTKQILWGYMEVEEVLKITGNECGSYHPHYYSHASYKDNTIYRPRKTLSFAPEMPGCGCLPFNTNHILSKTAGDKAAVYNIFSLPAAFIGVKIGGNRSVAQPDGDRCTLRFPDRGQEFVIEENDAIKEWAMAILGG